MWNEIKLVAWKERIQSFANKEIIVGIGLLPIVYGILFPLVFPSTPTNAPNLLSPDRILFIVFIAMCFVGVLDSSIQTVYAFAGEREANTLPTLLTTRISDSSLVLGKGLYSLMTGLVASFLFFALFATISYFTTPIGKEYFLFAIRDKSLLVAVFVLPVLFTVFSTAVGMLISTKVKNTKMGAGLATLPELPFIGVLAWFLFGNPLNLATWLNLVIVYVALALLTLAVFTLTLGMFNREKMTLRM